MKEALKLALEALESGVSTQIGRVAWTEYDSWLINEAITAIKEALAPTSTQCEVQPEQEPFGHWHWEQPMTKPLQGWFVKCPSDGKLNGVAGIALYTAPLLPVQEPVAELAGVAYVDDLDLWHFYPLRETDNFPDGTKFYTTPPKRPWVGLTAQEAADCWTTSATKTWHNFEAALRSKNI